MISIHPLSHDSRRFGVGRELVPINHIFCAATAASTGDIPVAARASIPQRGWTYLSVRGDRNFIYGHAAINNDVITDDRGVVHDGRLAIDVANFANRHRMMTQIMRVKSCTATKVK